MGMSIDKAIEEVQQQKLDYQEFWEEYKNEHIEALDMAISTMRKYQQLEDFARWVATEVIDEELWTYNHLAFTELACRKLVQLGIMQESDGEYSYGVVEDGSN